MTYPQTKSRVLQTSRLAGNPTSCSGDKAAGLPRSSVRQRQQQRQRRQQLRHRPYDVRESPGRLQHAAHVSPTKGIHTLRRAPDMSLSLRLPRRRCWSAVASPPHRAASRRLSVKVPPLPPPPQCSRCVLPPRAGAASLGVVARVSSRALVRWRSLARSRSDSLCFCTPPLHRKMPERRGRRKSRVRRRCRW